MLLFVLAILDSL